MTGGLAGRAARLALTVLQNRTGRVPRPSFCTYLVTYRCNARCGMCDSWRMKPGSEMTAADVAALFAKVGTLDVVRVTGGEPFLRPDLLDLCRAIVHASRPLVVHVTTNGSLTDDVVAFAERFPTPRRLRFMVSFDGGEAEHDRSRGADVTFQRALATVRALASLRRRLGLEVTVNHTVISPRSMDDAAGLRDVMDDLGVDVHTVLAYASSSMYGLKLRGKKAEHLIVPSGYPLHPSLEDADATGFVRRELSRTGRIRHPLVRRAKRYYLKGLLERLEGNPAPSPRPRCVALRSHLRLLPDGRVPVCQFNTESVGDLKALSFDQVWHGDGATAARSWVDACPGCWAECEVMPNATYTGDLLRWA